MIKKIAIFDMDGVLVDSSWRYRVSKVDNTKIDLQYWRDNEKAFIDNKLGKPNAIIYRKDNDNRGGAEMKIKGLKKLLSLKQFKDIKDITVFEDNAKYLKAICDYFKCKGVYIPSNQGH